MNMSFKRGFTLIELLVVIAIIGILASVILVSVNSARNKGNDAAVKANLDGIRTQAEIYYDSQSPTSYTNLCTSSPITQAVSSAGNAGGNIGTTHCYDSATAWAASAPLRAGGFWCVDSSGKSSTSTTELPSNQTTCP